MGFRGLVVVLCLTGLTACQAISKQAKEDLRKPVDCATAEADISTLRSEKASVAKRVLDGATAVVPTAAVVSILTLQEKDKLEVAIGAYNRQIDDKIEEIESSCGLSAQTPETRQPKAQLDTWNQAALPLAQRLDQQVRAIYEQARGQNQELAGGSPTRNAFDLVQDLQTLKVRTGALAAHIEDGKGQDETESLFRHIEMNVRDVAVVKRESILLQDAQPQINSARETLSELAGYYTDVAAPSGAKQ